MIRSLRFGHRTRKTTFLGRKYLHKHFSQ